jgi:hypothetical protein
MIVSVCMDDLEIRCCVLCGCMIMAFNSVVSMFSLKSCNSAGH